MVEASARTLVDYYGARRTAELLDRVAPLVERKVAQPTELVIVPDSAPQTMAQVVYDWLPLAQPANLVEIRVPFQQSGMGNPAKQVVYQLLR